MSKNGGGKLSFPDPSRFLPPDPVFLPCKADRVVAKDQCGNAKVSTVFLGVDYDFTGKKPLLFETMVFGGPYDGEEQRYSTWEEAEEGHKKVVSRLRGPNA